MSQFKMIKYIRPNTLRSNTIIDNKP